MIPKPGGSTMPPPPCCTPLLAEKPGGGTTGGVQQGGPKKSLWKTGQNVLRRLRRHIKFFSGGLQQGGYNRGGGMVHQGDKKIPLEKRRGTTGGGWVFHNKMHDGLWRDTLLFLAFTSACSVILESLIALV